MTYYTLKKKDFSLPGKTGFHDYQTCWGATRQSIRTDTTGPHMIRDTELDTILILADTDVHHMDNYYTVQDILI